MTACVNNEGLSGKKVVSATLAGVLAAGMVPAIAFADEAAEASPDEGIDLLVDNKGAFSTATLAEATINATTEKVVDLENIQFKYDGNAHYIVPKKIYLAGDSESTPFDVGTDTTTYPVTYFGAKADGTIDTGASKNAADIKSVGTYYARIVVASGTYQDAVVDFKFSIVGESFENAYIYEGADKTDSDFSFAGDAAPLTLNFAIGSTGLTMTDDYTVKYYKDGASSPLAAAPMYAGKYTAVLEGAGAYAGQKKEIPFEVKAIDLSKATIETSTASGEPKVTKVNDVAALEDFVELEFVSAEDGSKFFGNNTSYTYKAKFTTDQAKEDAASSVIGTQEIVIDKVEHQATFKYGATYEFSHYTGADSLAVHLADENPDYFDPSQITVEYDTSKKVPASNYVLTVKDEDGNAGTLDSLKTPGVWFVTATVNAEAMKYATGGNATMRVVVDNEVIDPSTNLFVKVDGKTVIGNSGTTQFTGSDVSKNVAIILKDSKGNVLTQGEDYDVTITNEDGEEVSEIINAGDYTYKLTSTSYNLGGEVSFTLTVNAIPLTDQNVRLDPNSMVQSGPAAAPTYFYAYTGEAITPVYQYTLSADGLSAADDEWMTLPADAFVATYSLKGKPVKEIIEVGEYAGSLTNNKDNGNFTIANAISIAPFKVSDEKIFEDVPSDAWFAKVVYQAEKNGYMNGYYGTKLFGANNNITRADVVCVLYNMAGGTLGTTDDDKGYTSFSDVDSKMYYAKAVAWAKKAGIANGFGDGTFGPEQNISRQDFACMLANFAKVKGDFTKPSDIDAILGGFDDGAQVADYAKESAAWAGEQKIMGNGGLIMPASTITRAEVAAMAINYQPEKIVK